MRLVDPRRLTGPNLLSREPMVLVDLGLDPGERAEVCREAYLAELSRMRQACGWSSSVEVRERGYRGGLFVAFEDPIDTLLASTEVAEWAALSACEILAGRAALPLEPKRSEISGMIAAQTNPRLLSMQAEARRRGALFLWDDQQVSLGSGRGARSWPVGGIPPGAEVPWAEISSVPLALITGTNGKTTCARLLARCAREAGLHVGLSSTDGTWVDDQQVEGGDMAGPAGARQVLRQPTIDFAVLETARGGILRRGLAVDQADAALITNVSSDHLGDSGVDDLQTMARLKGVITQVVRPSGRVVLNALDPQLMALRSGASAPVILFSRDPDAPGVRDHLAKGGEAWVARDGSLSLESPGGRRPLVRIDEIPVTYGGAAVHNIENALAVAALASALGLPGDAVVRALHGFSNATDNPRRGTVAEVGGVGVLLDFGHNPEGVRSALCFARALRKGQGRLAVITGFAGDRTPEDIAQVTRIICDEKPGLVLVRDLEHYLRGRAPGEVPQQVRKQLLDLGAAPSAVRIASTEVDALREALDWAKPGDFVALLVYLDAPGVEALLAERGATLRP